MDLGQNSQVIDNGNTTMFHQAPDEFACSDITKYT